jgi:hypothetical protein
MNLKVHVITVVPKKKDVALISWRIYWVLMPRNSWWQWPRRLRHELSSPAQTLWSWVRFQLEAWMSVCVYSVFVLFCVQIAALRRADLPSKEFYRLCIGLRNWKSGQGPTKGCRAIDTMK